MQITIDFTIMFYYIDIYYNRNILFFIENFRIIIKTLYNNKSKIIYRPPERMCEQ